MGVKIIHKNEIKAVAAAGKADTGWNWSKFPVFHVGMGFPFRPGGSEGARPRGGNSFYNINQGIRAGNNFFLVDSGAEWFRWPRPQLFGR